jgi:hypothetical protein
MIKTCSHFPISFLMYNYYVENKICRFLTWIKICYQNIIVIHKYLIIKYID